MPDGATRKLLHGVRWRLWLQRVIDRVWLALMLTSGILSLAAALHTFRVAVPMIWWGPVALLPLVAAVIVAVVFDRPSVEQSARAADRWLESRDLFTAACYLRSRASRETSATAAIVLAQADQVAADSSPSLFRLHESRQRPPAMVAVAVAAASLFLLSLQGAAPSGGSSTSMPVEFQVRGEAVEHDWLLALEPRLPDGLQVIAATRPSRQRSGDSLRPSIRPEPRASTGTVAGERGDSDSSSRSSALQPTAGAGVGRDASMQAARPEPSRAAAKGAVAPKFDVELVAVQRKQAGGTVAIDHAVSVELIPLASDLEQPERAARRAPAARAAKEPFSADVAPAYRALQARYFEGAWRHD